MFPFVLYVADNKVRELNTQTLIDATQQETAIDQQHSSETLVCQRHQTILRLLSSAATASTRWRVRELYCSSTYSFRPYHGPGVDSAPSGNEYHEHFLGVKAAGA